MSSLGTAEASARERVVGHGHDVYDAVRARVAALAGVSHPGLDAPSRVTMLPGEAVAVAEPGYGASTLRATLDSRGTLTAGECVWVGMAVAEALAALHRAGVFHGAVDTDAVRLPAGGVLLAHLVDGAQEATAADDVAALGRMLEQCVTGQDLERVRAWTEPMTHTDSAARPTAAMVARALGSCAPSEPLQQSPRGVASSMRAAVSQPAKVRRLPQARTWRWRQAVRARSLKVALLVAATLAVVWGVSAAVTLWGEGSAMSPLAAGVAGGEHDPAWVAREATQARFEALRSSDNTDALLTWTVDGSPAQAEAQSTADAVASGRMAVEGLTVTIDQLEADRSLVDTTGVAVVRVTYTLSDHVVTVDGQATRFDAYSQTVDLTLERMGGVWRVHSAVDAATEAAT